MEQFRRERQAITRAGQIKGGGERHEKDDRRRLDDRSAYVLGWSNEGKIAVLEKQAKQLEGRMQGFAEQIAKAAQEQSALRERLDGLSKIDVFDNFNDLDWQPLAVIISELEAEKRALEAASDLLQTLTAQLKTLEEKLKQIENTLVERNKEAAKNEEKLEQANLLLAESRATVEAFDLALRDTRFIQLEIGRAHV